VDHTIESDGNLDVDRMEMLDDIRNEYPELQNNEAFLEDVREFYKLLEALEAKVHEGTNVSVLQVVIRLMAMRSKYTFSNNCYNDFVNLIIDISPPNHNMPNNLYRCKKLVAGLGMNYQKIDACEDNCMLFWKEHENTTHCIHCSKSRYAVVLDEDGNKVTTKVLIKQLRYMPITPQLKRLFLNQETTKQMRWHKEGDRQGQDPNVMVHPSDELTPVLTELEICLRFAYPVMVTEGSQEIAAHYWAHWDLKPYGSDGTHTSKVWDLFWGQFRVCDPYTLDDPYVCQVFNGSADRAVKVMMYKARLRVVTVYQKRQGNYCDANMAKEIHLTAQQYKESEVDWLSQHLDAWAWMCEYWASEEFLAISNRNRMNRLSKPGVHFFGADGHVGKAARMEARNGVEPTLLQVFVKGHKGPNPNHPEILNDSNATEKLARYIQNVREKNGPEADWLTRELLEKMTQMEEIMAQYKQQVQQQMQQMQNWMLHQMYGGAGTQFAMPPYQQPPIITHPMYGQSSDRALAAADGSQ
ncbi:hypothetical protein ACJX0J_041986, partial [Zea mays]